MVDGTFDIPLSFTSWRTNVNFIGAIMVTADLPPNLLGDYHLSGAGSPAYNLGADYKCLNGATICSVGSGLRVPAPTFDIDNQQRPYSVSGPGINDAGADEWMP